MLLIDGNNLWYAAMQRGEPLNGISRGQLLRVLDRFARRSEREVVVVLDGHRPGRAAIEGDLRGGARRIYADASSADDRILRLVNESSEPRRLTVVSSDRSLVRQVRRRRVRVVPAELFAGRLEHWLRRPSGRRRGVEPTAKRTGLGGDEAGVNHWLKFFDVPPETSDIIRDDRAGSTDGGQDQQFKSDTSRSSKVQRDAALDLHQVQAELDRLFNDVQPLKRRDRRR